MAEPITIPLINPNELEACLIRLYVEEGQAVEGGELLCTLETTKSTVDVTAQLTGFVISLRFKEGDYVKAGDLFAYLAEEPDWQPLEVMKKAIKSTSENPLPSGLRISQPALDLARAKGLDLDGFPKDVFITSEMVQEEVDQANRLLKTHSERDLDSSAIIIYGAGGHGKSVLEFLQLLGSYDVVGFIDDGLAEGETVLGVPVLGNRDVLPGLFEQGIGMAVNAVGGIGNLRIRQRVFNRLLNVGFVCPAIIHPTAFVESSAVILAGSQVFPFAYVGSDVKVSFGSIINTGAVVSHECILGELVNIAPNAILAGGVSVGDGVLVGMGVTVNLSVQIGEGARVGNGSTVKNDVPPHAVIPAGSIWLR